jgi:hypothetical protein
LSSCFTGNQEMLAIHISCSKGSRVIHIYS